MCDIEHGIIAGEGRLAENNLAINTNVVVELKSSWLVVHLTYRLNQDLLTAIPINLMGQNISSLSRCDE